MEADTSSGGGRYHFRRQRSGNCGRVAVVFGFLVGLEMCMLQFTRIAVENWSELVRTVLKILGVLLMLVSVLFMVVVSTSDNEYAVESRPSVRPLLEDEASVRSAERGADDSSGRSHLTD